MGVTRTVIVSSSNSAPASARVTGSSPGPLSANDTATSSPVGCTLYWAAASLTISALPPAHVAPRSTSASCAAWMRPRSFLELRAPYSARIAAPSRSLVQAMLHLPSLPSSSLTACSHTGMSASRRAFSSASAVAAALRRSLSGMALNWATVSPNSESGRRGTAISYLT
jgi:hypothetical protein